MMAAPDPGGRIRELEEQNAELARRVKEFETLLECIPVAVAIAADRDCREVRINRAAASLLGVPPDSNPSKTGPEADKVPFRITAKGLEVPGEQLPMQVAARENRSIRNVPLDVHRTDGSILHELCLAEPLRDQTGHPRGAIGVFLDVTLSQRAEQALRESEARYRFLAEALPQIVWISTTDNNVVYINGHWTLYTGMSLEETINGGWRHAVHPQDLPRIVRHIAEARGNGIAELEFRLRRASDEAWRWHVARLRLVTTEDGEQRWLGTSADIHDRKQAEEQLETALGRQVELRQDAESALHEKEEIEQQLMLLVEASSTLVAMPASNVVLSRILELARTFVGADAYAVWRVGGDGFNWSIVAEHGLSSSYPRKTRDDDNTAQSMPMHALAIENVQDSPLLASRAEFYRAESICSMLLVPLSIHGRIEGTISFYYRTEHTFSNLETRVGAAIASLAAAAIGTAELYEKQTELRLQAEAAERRANFLSEAGRVLSSSLDIETTLSSVAELAVPAVSDWVTVDLLEDSGELRRLAIKHSDPTKVALAQEYSRKYPPQESPGIMRALRTGTSILVRELPKHLFQNRAGDEQIEMIRQLGLNSYIIAPLISGGRTLGLLYFVNAESGRRFEQTDLMLAEELAGRAATAIANARLYREQKIAQEALQRSNTELKRANEDVNQFAYSASHDLKEPLRMVGIYSQLLEAQYQAQLDERAHLYLHYISSGATRMDLLIRDILAYTQTAADISADSVSPTSAAVALDAALQNLEASIHETQARITFDALPELRVQEIHLVQLFQNLVSNAIKYRSAAAPEIRITAEKAGDLWKISVTDNGIGIAPQYSEQIFGIFTRLHTADEYSGTGIGLAICLKIVERYGGEIKVESQEGSGSTFWFTLP